MKVLRFSYDHLQSFHFYNVYFLSPVDPFLAILQFGRPQFCPGLNLPGRVDVSAGNSGLAAHSFPPGDDRP